MGALTRSWPGRPSAPERSCAPTRPWPRSTPTAIGSGSRRPAATCGRPATCWPALRPGCSPSCSAIRRPADKARRARSSSSTSCCAVFRGCATTRSAPRTRSRGRFTSTRATTSCRPPTPRRPPAEIPALPPCEAYCHSLTDPSILGSGLRAPASQTLTVFGLHMPERLFREDHAEAKAARGAGHAGVDRQRARRADRGLPAADRRTANRAWRRTRRVELEHELGLPGGNIFHRPLQWPFAESQSEVGRWGVETERPNVWMCGSGARRGGAVSGIAGHNAARAVLAADG